MARKRTGTIDRYVPAKPGERHGHYVVRVTAPDGTRPLFHMDPTPKSKQERKLALEHAGHICEQLWEQGLGAVPSRWTRETRKRAADGTMQKWLDDWLDDRRRRGLTSADENESQYRVHIKPAIGSHIQDWTAEDLRALCRSLDDKIRAGTMSWKTAWNVWGTATKMCADACRSKIETLRVRDDNPAEKVAGPDRGVRTAKQYLYPSEFLAFVRCERVPLIWRRTVALAVYLFPRAGELRVLRWEDVDLEHGTIHIHRAKDPISGREKETKTGTARRFSIDAALMPLLRALHDDATGETVMELPPENGLARVFRRWLEVAGVKRAELHTATPTRKAMTFYDLRATGITWMAVRGDDPLKIMQRAGHSSFSTTQGYIREAEAVRAGFGDVFPTLPTELLRAPIVTANRHKMSQVFGTIVGAAGFEPATSSV